MSIKPGEDQIVPAAGQTAYVSGRTVPNHRNLPMTAFLKYINGTDPASPVQSYNYMRGQNQFGQSIVDPSTGRVTTYMVPGDPVQSQGWVDSGPADRRAMVCAGPFNMAPGDSQIVAVAVAIGHGPNRLASITALKESAGQLTGLFREAIEAPSLPPQRLWDWTPEPRWLTGIDTGLSTFFGGVGYGYEFFGSTLADSEYVEVKIRFDSSETTTCARYDRNQQYLWVGDGLFHGSARDMSDPAHPRRLNICLSEYNLLDGVWEPDGSDEGGREYLFVMNSDYNGGADYNNEDFG